MPEEENKKPLDKTVDIDTSGPEVDVSLPEEVKEEVVENKEQETKEAVVTEVKEETKEQESTTEPPEK